MAKTKEAPADTQAAPAQPDLTLSGLITNATEGEERAKAMLHQQMGVKAFLESLAREGYEIVKKAEE